MEKKVKKWAIVYGRGAKWWPAFVLIARVKKEKYHELSCAHHFNPVNINFIYIYTHTHTLAGDTAIQIGSGKEACLCYNLKTCGHMIALVLAPILLTSSQDHNL